jgi:hypothetical protein
VREKFGECVYFVIKQLDDNKKNDNENNVLIDLGDTKQGESAGCRQQVESRVMGQMTRKRTYKEDV